ncbi:H-NS family nucleoid-associated regulatory protein [Paraburkholderia sp. RL18-103-BIB-C]|uniref:H-NS family nucleoid-associated regulatory protein n=1 Tax=Paraburkholderia sp. RL18-103-BIB-C TaxID=3031637 RepID=UPI0038BB2B77
MRTQLPPKGEVGRSLCPWLAVGDYRDPKSGATWSGRGRAPAWLAGAKGRYRSGSLELAARPCRRPTPCSSGKTTRRTSPCPRP